MCSAWRVALNTELEHVRFFQAQDPGSVNQRSLGIRWAVRINLFHRKTLPGMIDPPSETEKGIMLCAAEGSVGRRAYLCSRHGPVSHDANSKITAEARMEGERNGDVVVGPTHITDGYQSIVAHLLRGNIDKCREPRRILHGLRAQPNCNQQSQRSRSCCTRFGGRQIQFLPTSRFMKSHAG
jgi:hypothetical protein